MTKYWNITHTFAFLWEKYWSNFSNAKHKQVAISCTPPLLLTATEIFSPSSSPLSLFGRGWNLGLSVPLTQSDTPVSSVSVRRCTRHRQPCLQLLRKVDEVESSWISIDLFDERNLNLTDFQTFSGSFFSKLVLPTLPPRVPKKSFITNNFSTSVQGTEERAQRQQRQQRTGKRSHL